MAAYAAALSTRPVRFDDVRAWSVTTTFAPAALHSSLSLHRTWQMPAVRYFVALLLQTNPTDLLTKKKKNRGIAADSSGEVKEGTTWKQAPQATPPL